jgi:hypothetical protein
MSIVSSEWTRAFSQTERQIESLRVEQGLEFKNNLIKLTLSGRVVDLARFSRYCLYCLPPQMWEIVEDYERTEGRLIDLQSEKKPSLRLQTQLEYFRESMLKTLISGMTYRQRNESFPVRVLEVMELEKARRRREN